MRISDLSSDVCSSDLALTEERCFISEWSNHDDDPALSIARARVSPGVTTRWHRLHHIIERYVILEGHGLVELGDQPPIAVAIGDIVHIPAGVAQRIRNDGDRDLVDRKSTRLNSSH